MIAGGGGEIRTHEGRKPLPVFRPHFGFHRQRLCLRSWAGSCLRLSLAALGGNRLISTPSLVGLRAWLGVASALGQGVLRI